MSLKECKCVIPNIQPISVNAMYRSFKGRTILSARGRTFKKEISEFLSSLENIDKIYGDVCVEIHIMFADKRKRDIDNYSKAILDSLKDVLFEDDCCIQKLIMSKKIGTGINQISVAVSECV